MPTTSFTFNFAPNVSLQVGDILYYAPTTSTGGFSTGSQDSIIRVGEITSITINSATNFTVVADVSTSFGVDTNNMPYFFFGKNSVVNTGSILGYYSRVKFTNNSTEKGDKKGEMFASTCQVEESSK
tara:strand:+ start:12388 stop:12768 length:381 start_codon:yes stop_codon:yes gene_type:complete